PVWSPPGRDRGAHGFWGQSMTDWALGPALAAFHAGVTVVGELAAQFTDDSWAAPTPCPEWRAGGPAAPPPPPGAGPARHREPPPAGRRAGRVPRGGAAPWGARMPPGQTAGGGRARAGGEGPEHRAACAAPARAYARRLPPVWDLPHHRYRETVVTVGGMAGAACAEWHLHAWDLAWALGKVYSPADPDILVAGWQAGMPHVPLGVPAAVASCGAGPGGRVGAR